MCCHAEKRETCFQKEAATKVAYPMAGFLEILLTVAGKAAEGQQFLPCYLSKETLQLPPFSEVMSPL
ncbi:hypothetical protein LEMLEM_LOCUS24904 [Lemmus lemmus]